jgi:hypothetical protein
MGMELGHGEPRRDLVDEAVAVLKARLGDYFKIWSDEPLDGGRRKVILLVNQTRTMREKKLSYDMDLADEATKLGLFGFMRGPYEVEITVHPSWRP